MDDHQKPRSPSEGASDSSGQDHCSALGHSSRSSNKGQVRHRASIACASCRERRIRCVVPEGSTECTQCKRSGAECIIRNDDERRRPISKAYMSSLSSRIALLESMLKERGVVPPPAVHPPKTRQEAQAQQQHQLSSTAFNLNQPQSSETDSSAAPFLIKQEDVEVHEQFLSHSFEPQEGDSAHQSFFQDGFPWKFPFYGPTACTHGYSSPLSMGVLHGPRDHDRRARKLIESLTTSTREHLISCFWDHYNPMHQVVDRQSFEADRRAQKPKFYSTFLHLAMLAAGYRFSDRSRETVKRFTLGSWESTLHRETRFLVESELERPGGLTSVQGLLILGDLEFGAGRDTAGWIYSGIANRLAFALGLQVQDASWDSMGSGADVKRLVMTACVMFDRHWALLLGRPTTIKNQDLGIKLLPKERFPLTSSPTIDELVHQRLLELMDLASKIADSQNTAHDTSAILATTEGDGNAYLQAVTLDQQLQAWYRRLPEELSWTPGNIKAAPFSFFMLHQQYHTCMILLYRPWAKYGPITLEGLNGGYHTPPASQNQTPPKDGFNHGLGSSGSISSEGRVALSRRMCTQHAVRVARIFWHHRHRGFDGTKISVMGIQHAGTSALALMASLAHHSPDLDQRSNLSYLHVLSTAIYDMSRVYQPAARMYQHLKAILAEIRAKLARPSALRASIPLNTSQSIEFGLPNSWPSTRRADNHYPVSSFQNGTMAKLEDIPGLEPPSKRRRLGPGSRRASEIAIPTSSFLKPSDEQWYKEAANNGALDDATRLLGLGKHARHYSYDDIEISATSNTFEISDGLEVTGAFGYEFFADLDLVGEDKNDQSKDGKDAAGASAVGNESVVQDAVETESPELKPDCGDGEANVNSDSGESSSIKQEPTATNQLEPQQGDKLRDGGVSPDAIDATIEEWLAEPPGLTPTSLPHDAFSGSGSVDSPIQFEDGLPTIPESTTCCQTTGAPITTATFAPSSPHAYNLLSDTLSVLTAGHQFQPDLTTSSASNNDTFSSSGGGDGELESWMAAAFGIGSDAIDQMLSPESLNPSLGTDNIGGISKMSAGKDVLLKGLVEKKRGCDEMMMAGCGIDASIRRKGLKALDYLEL
ncbi:fungal-specific transcription factor [Rhypophila decipiens]|uniref:Fungal-specific transcription factor n=1 Tax=Rhypophila decipiens TaxID=261697 RepID=A0AAN6YE74_9PEZI|nr:fungal-specific transcription factor [Rhypophila decipiens]